MKVACTSCGKPFTFDEARFGERPVVKVRCPSCKTVVELTRPSASPAGPGEEDAAAKSRGSSPTQKLKRDEVLAAAGGDILLPMPQDRRVSLAILNGKGSGQIVHCERSRVIIGRTGADLSLDDEEVSRRHAALEIREDRFFLKDLGSTNGTFVDERKITEAEIFDKGEFRIGGTQIMLIVTPMDEV
jgi:phage FluMu protein Com